MKTFVLSLNYAKEVKMLYFLATCIVLYMFWNLIAKGFTESEDGIDMIAYFAGVIFVFWLFFG